MAPEWRYNGGMAVALSIKNVPDRLASALQKRAARNHRSLQGELMHILEEALAEKPFRAHELVRQLEKHKLPAGDGDIVAMIREDRDR